MHIRIVIGPLAVLMLFCGLHSIVQTDFAEAEVSENGLIFYGGGEKVPQKADAELRIRTGDNAPDTNLKNESAAIIEAERKNDSYIGQAYVDE